MAMNVSMLNMIYDDKIGLDQLGYVVARKGIKAQEILIGDNLVSGAMLSSGTWANRPTSPSTGQFYLMTDFNLLVMYDGTKWKPPGGAGILCNDGTAHTGAGTGSEANYAAKLIPGGLVSANGGLGIIALSTFAGTTGGKTIIIRHSTSSGATSGTTIENSSLGGSASTLTVISARDVWNTGAVNSQIMMNAGYAGYGATSGITTAVATTGSINMSADSYINFNINGNASDTVGYQGLRIVWYEQ